MFAARVLAARQERVAAKAYDVGTYGHTKIELAMLGCVRADVARVVLGDLLGGAWPERVLVDAAMGMAPDGRRDRIAPIDNLNDLVDRYLAVKCMTRQQALVLEETYEGELGVGPGFE